VKVFISYSSVDKAMASQIQKELKGLGINTFLDEKEIGWGDRILERVAQGITDCTDIVVIISPASLKSQWVSFEVGHAMALGKKVLPFLAHPSIDPPDFLRQLRYKSTLKDMRLHFSRLLEAAAQVSKGSSGTISPEERDGIRAARNELLEARMRRESGVTDADVFQIDDHTDNGFALFVQFEDAKTSAGELVARVRELFVELFPGVPVWGEMQMEEDTSIVFVYTYLDKWNRRFRKAARGGA